MAKLLEPQSESQQPEKQEKVWTPEQLEKGRRMMARMRQAAILAAQRIREKEAQERLAALPPATPFIN
jgi:hypothetical protein